MNKMLLMCLCVITLLVGAMVGLMFFSSKAIAQGDGIIVEGADYISTTTNEYSAELTSITKEVTSRVVVEYGDFNSKLELNKSDELNQAASAVSSRVAIEYADFISTYESQGSDALLQATTTVTSRIIVEYADSITGLGLQGSQDLIQVADAVTPRIIVEYADSIFSTDLEPWTPPPPTPDFSITASPTSLAVQQGGSDTSVITITSIGGFNQPVQLTVSGAPSEVTTTLNPEQVTPPPDGSITSTLTVSVSMTSTPGSYTLTVRGTNDTLTHSIDVSLEILTMPTSEQPQLKAPWVGIAEITQGNNGATSHYDHGTWDNTYAIDVALPVNSDVLAPADGVIKYVDSDPSGAGGKELAIEHTGPTGKKFVMVYLHLNEILVREGKFVKQGQIVAKSGATGDVTGPHMHFHMWRPKGSEPEWAYDSHTMPIERLVMKQVGVDSDFREYDARKGELNDDKIAGKLFESNNIPLSPNMPPVADAGLDRSVSSGDLVQFDGSNSYDLDLDGSIVSYRWNFGDGTTAEGRIVSHRFRGAQNEPKTYTVTLTVEDNNGATATDTIYVTATTLQKAVEVSKSSAFAKMTITYNWIEKSNGEDIYIISNIQVEANGYVGTFVPTIWVWEYQYPIGEVPVIDFLDYLFVGGRSTQKTYATPFSTKPVIGISPPIAKQIFDEGTFEGIQVKGSDVMSIYLQGFIPKIGWPPIDVELFEFSSTPFDPLVPASEPSLLQKLLDKLLDMIVGQLGSPGELRVYDSEGRITGLVNGEVREEIPNSAYINNTVLILSQGGSYRYEVVGTEDGSYGLAVASFKQGKSNTFTATNLPISTNAIHQYTIDWATLSDSEKGVTIKIDSDGDGNFEKTFTANSELTRDEFIVQADATKPVANAGSDQTVDEDTLVTFDASGSSDNVGVMSYTWTFTDAGTLQTLDGMNPTYTFQTPGIYTVTLNVTDAAGNHATDTVTITVLDITKPVANAGSDLTVNEDSQITLDGSASSDNIAITAYTWAFTDVTLKTLTGEKPTYTFNTPGTYTITLNVTDNAGNWATDTITITVLDITKPTANAGQDQTVNVGVAVTFDAGASTDNVGIVNYDWDFGDGTTGKGKTTTHAYANPGTYTVRLTVKDAAGNTDTDSITITVFPTEAPPPEAFPMWIVGVAIATIAIAIAAIAIFWRKRKQPATK